MKIRILVTGGTIDGLEYDSPKKAPQKHKSIIPDLLKQARAGEGIFIEELMQKDSKFVTDEDRELILAKCSACAEDRIVITHGTVTMPQTAIYLGKKRLSKTIVLTGAAIPGNKKNTDALFNLGSAVTAVQILSHGVYITMNGRIFPWNNVKKNMKKGIFETLK